MLHLVGILFPRSSLFRVTIRALYFEDPRFNPKYGYNRYLLENFKWNKKYFGNENTKIIIVKYNGTQSYHGI